MKDELRKYFPDRFPDPDNKRALRIFTNMFVGYNEIKRRMDCERAVIDVYNQSDEIRLLTGAMRKYGCDFNLLRHVSCEECQGCEAGFDPDANQIIICQNKSINKNRLLTAMVHEMIHMFDYCRAKFDYNNLEHLACSEVSSISNKHPCNNLMKAEYKPSILSQSYRYELQI